MSPPERAPVPDHWLRHNRSEWAPRHLLFLDTETLPHRDGNREVHHLRLWTACHVDRRPGPGLEPAWAWAHGATRAGLAEWVDSRGGSRGSYWLYAHNLGFDLTVTDLIGQLHRLGWRLGQFHFAGRGVTGTMTKGNKTVHLCDSYSLLHAPLERVGRLLDIPKLPMPPFEAADDAWAEYCARDVEVLATAVLQAVDWWQAGDHGRWTATGAALGWNAMRHLDPHPRIVVKTDPDGVAADRSAIYSGRRDVSRMGALGRGPYALLDFRDAYATTAAHQLLPKGRHLRLDGPAVWARLGGRLPAPVLADVTVTVDRPIYPLRTDRGILYPVGTFRTTLAGPELAHAALQGHLIEAHGGWHHELGWELAPWARWVLGLAHPAPGAVPPVVPLMAHQWGRSVIGKFAGRTARVEDRGPALWPWWHLERGVDVGADAAAADVHIAGRHLWYVFDQDADNAYPAVLAWVESYVRLALSKMLEALGDAVWVSCNTDGAIIDLRAARAWLSEAGIRLEGRPDPVAVGEAVCDQLAPVTQPLRARVKAIGRHLHVVGPQHYRSDGFQSWAGRPARLELDPGGRQVGWAWPGARWQMAEGDPAGFVRVRQEWTDPQALAYRWVLRDGTALPLRARIGVDGGVEVLPWASMPEAVAGLELALEQAPALKGLH